MLNSAAEFKDKLNGRLSTCCWYFACMAVRASVLAVYSICHASITFDLSLKNMCLGYMLYTLLVLLSYAFAINLLFRYGENFA